MLFCGRSHNTLQSNSGDAKPDHAHGDASPKSAAGHKSDASPRSAAHVDSPKSKPAPKPESPRHQPQEDAEANMEGDSEASKPSAAELAKKRAERFGIPLVAKVDESKETAPKDESASQTPAEGGDSSEKKPSSMEKYRDLIASSLEEGSIIVVEDLVSDSRNGNLFQKVIDQFGEDKIREIIKDVVAKIAESFNNDRSTIESPPRLAGFRISRALKAVLPKLPNTDRKEYEKKPEKKDSWKGKWTDEEWAEWNKKKEETGGYKKKDWGDWKKGQGEWKSNDWNSGNKRKDYSDKRDDKWDSKKKRSHSYDAFESDVEEFIYRNRLDKKASKILREETKGMVTYVMDQGFDLKRYDNPSREVMLRCKDYIRTKKGDGAGKGSRGHSARSPSRSRSRSRGYRSRSRSRSPRDNRGPSKRSMSRGRSPSRSDSRDRYRGRSRSASV